MIWQFTPNWAGSYSVTKSYLTDVLTSQDGTEQRIAERNTPRRTYVFAVQEVADRLRTLKRILATRQHIEQVIPDSVRVTTISAATSVSATSFQVPAVPRWLINGAKIVLGDKDKREIATVNSIIGTTIGVSTPLTIAHAVRSRVYRAVTGSLDVSLSVNDYTTDVAEASITFNQTPLSEPYVAPPSASVTFNSREVMMQMPNWGQSVNTSFDHPVEKVDYNFGAVQTYVDIPFGTRTRKATFSNMTVDKVLELEDMFDRMRGRQGEFYMPTGEPDLISMADIASGATYIQIAGSEVYDCYATDLVYRAICILTKTGTQIYKLVSAITLVGGNSRIGLTVAMGSAVSLSSIQYICWMPVCRFASDDMTTEWLTDQVAQCALTIQTLPAMTPEP